jgi:hypothetical protein
MAVDLTSDYLCRPLDTSYKKRQDGKQAGNIQKLDSAIAVLHLLPAKLRLQVGIYNASGAVIISPGKPNNLTGPSSSINYVGLRSRDPSKFLHVNIT